MLRLEVIVRLLTFILTVWGTREVGVAVIEQLRDNPSRETFSIRFEKNDVRDPVIIRSSFDLPESQQRIISWKINELPMKMGSESCSELLLGSCFECPAPNPAPNDPFERSSICVEGKSALSTAGTALPKCAKIKGKDGVVGRSVAVTVEDSSSSPQRRVYCATIYDESNQHPDFVSTIAWFNEPLAGYVAFRRESISTAYIIVNLTRTVDIRNHMEERLMWEIREKPGSSKLLYNPKNSSIGTSTYSEQCDEDKSDMGCAVGDLWRKHEKLVLRTYHSSDDLQINLRMYVDSNLPDTSLLIGKDLVFFITTISEREEIVASAVIEDLSPVAVEVPFLDGSSLLMTQRDDWSAMQHRLNPASSSNTVGRWDVTVHLTPTIQIFGGEEWNCEKRWSAAPFLPTFTTIQTWDFLNHTYTLYGRNSMLYRGVSISTATSDKELCSTITYKQGEEKIAYTKLKTTWNEKPTHKGIIIFIEHKVLRQTTIMLATLCRSNQIFLELTQSKTCKNSPSYNPYGVCPAICLPQTVYNRIGDSDEVCKRECTEGGCCSLCVYNSSYLCPVGDLRRRLGIFPTAHSARHYNKERVFNVKNDVNLPIAALIGNYIGGFMNEGVLRGQLAKCGKVEELKDTVVVFNLSASRNVTLTQKAAWQPITVAWSGIELKSLKFWAEPAFDQTVCPSVDKETPIFDFHDFPSSPRQLTRNLRGPTFFGGYSVLGKSVTVEWESLNPSRDREETRHTITTSGSHNDTLDLEAEFTEEHQTILKFKFKQRTDHLTSDTYITVKVMSRKYCKERFKWYIIDKGSADSFAEGQTLQITEYDDSRLFQFSGNDDCLRAQPPNHLAMGDFSSKFGNLDLDGRPGKTFIHENLPLIRGNSTKELELFLLKNLAEVEGHYLFLANDNNTIIGKERIKLSPKKSTSHHEKAVDPPQAIPTWLILVCVSCAVMVIAVLSFIYYYKCLGSNNNIDYDNLSHEVRAGEQRCKTERGRVKGKQVLIMMDEVGMGHFKVQDMITGEVWNEHYKNITWSSQYPDSNGSTNGSSMARSFDDRMETNVYVSPITTGNRDMSLRAVTNSVIGSPDSTSTSTSSSSQESLGSGASSPPSHPTR